eukprot:jgi/Hompol1/6234/HPOL_004893-RA
MNVVKALLVASLMLWLGVRGYRSKSLSYSGAVAAVVLGSIIFSHPSLLFGVVLLVFYYSSSKLTKFKTEIKKRLEEDHLDGGQRTAIQVLSNGLTGLVACVIHWRLLATADGQPANQHLLDVVLYAYVAHFACCNGDTWASELGILSPSQPVLITTLKPVPPGTNGGITRQGISASLGGGNVIGLAAWLVMLIESYIRSGTLEISDFRMDLIYLGTFAGLGGSLVSMDLLSRFT